MAKLSERGQLVKLYNKHPEMLKKTPDEIKEFVNDLPDEIVSDILRIMKIVDEPVKPKGPK